MNSTVTHDDQNDNEEFDLGSPPAEKPEGETHLPDLWWRQNPIDSMPMPKDVAPKPLSFNEQMEQMPTEQLPGYDQLSEIQKTVVNNFRNEAWFKYSNYLRKYVTSMRDILEHAAEYEKDLRKQKRIFGVKPPKLKDEFAQQYVAWQRECAARKEWIDKFKMEWRKRVGERDEALKQWDSYVKEARYAYQRADATPIPPRPQEN